MAKLGRPLKDHQRSTTGKTTRTTYVSCQEMHQRGDFIPSALQSLIEKHEIGGLAQHGLFLERLEAAQLYTIGAIHTQTVVRCCWFWV